MIHYAQARREAAEILWQVKAVNFRGDDPYSFASGIKSPIYMNCRAPIFFPQQLERLMTMAVELIKPLVADKGINILAGGETAGIPYAMYLARTMMLPMIYVRKKPKGYGMNASIEGGTAAAVQAATGAPTRALLVEDLATNGGSKINFVQGLRGADFACNDAFVIFYYGIFPMVKQMDDMAIDMHCLTTAEDVFQVARDKKLFDNQTLGAVEAFLANPLDWSHRHGGVGSF